MSIPNYVALRKRTYHYVRRIPDDLQAAFGKERIQRSLKTSDQGEALRLAGIVNAEVEKQFAAARQEPSPVVVLIEGHDWSMKDWADVALWFEAQLYHEDMLRRLPRFTGAILIDEVRRPKDHMSDQATFRAHRDRYMRFQELTVVEYSRERLDFINSTIRPLRVSMTPTNPHLLPFAAACQKAEINFCLAFFSRDAGKQVDWVYPDAIMGRWMAAAPSPQAPPSPAISFSPFLQPASLTQPPARVSEGTAVIPVWPQQRVAVGKTLADCRDQWIVRKTAAKKRVDLRPFSPP
ncbi:DUF6538 domain-containing protein, partial [Bosea thiooxidans]|uniref:DUF6538 domain-containing protein n=1 Tax=Bosea thiooxidans TaxID=53254 RepID=UPI000AC80407